MGKIGEGAWSTLYLLSKLKRPHSENDDPIDALAEAVAPELEDEVAVAETPLKMMHWPKRWLQSWKTRWLWLWQWQ